LEAAGNRDHERGREQRRSGLEEDEGGPRCNFIEMQGPYCNALINFKLVLNWRWAQKKKCRVFQNVQLYFKVHSQKS
jgi:hypothetical protein